MIHDIAHCSNEKCKIKEQCYRWFAFQEIKQRYGYIVGWINGKDNNCHYFMSKDK